MESECLTVVMGREETKSNWDYYNVLQFLELWRASSSVCPM